MAPSSESAPESEADPPSESSGDADASPLPETATAEVTASEEPAQVDPADSLEQPKLFRELGLWGKVVRVAAIAFLILHFGSMLVGGAIAPIQQFFKPVIGLYTDALRMSNSWGMFGKPPTATNVFVEGVRLDGTTKELSTTDAHHRSIMERVRDSRMRKFEGRLSEEGDRRRFGENFLIYFCEVAKIELGKVREVRVVNVTHELRDDDDKVIRPASTQVVLTRRCGEKTPPHLVLPALPRAPGGAPPPPQGGDL